MIGKLIHYHMIIAYVVDYHPSCMPSGFSHFLNFRFMELSSLLDPGNPPKTDKAAILSDAARVVTQLRNEAQKLKDSNESLQEKIKELKASGPFMLHLCHICVCVCAVCTHFRLLSCITLKSK